MRIHQIYVILPKYIVGHWMELARNNAQALHEGLIILISVNFQQKWCAGCRPSGCRSSFSLTSGFVGHAHGVSRVFLFSTWSWFLLLWNTELGAAVLLLCIGGKATSLDLQLHLHVHGFGSGRGEVNGRHTKLCSSAANVGSWGWFIYELAVSALCTSILPLTVDASTRCWGAPSCEPLRAQCVTRPQVSPLLQW